MKSKSNTALHRGEPRYYRKLVKELKLQGVPFEIAYTHLQARGLIISRKYYARLGMPRKKKEIVS